MLDEFYTGGFGVIGPCVAWDGTNHQEILAWLVAKSDTYPITIESVTATELVLGVQYGGSLHTYTVPVGGWVYSGGPGVATLDSEGRWATPDPGGRPTDVNDLLYDEPA